MSSIPANGDGEVDKDTVLGLRKGLAIIASFNDERPRMSSSDAAELTGTTRAAARRSLLTLCKIGYARFDGKYFHLQPKILELGYNYLSALKLPELIQPTLDAISERVEESSSAAVRDGTDVVYIARSAKRRLMSVDIGVGTRLPAFCTSLGRVLLAFQDPEESSRYLSGAKFEKHTPKTVTDRKALRAIIDEVREKGFSIVDEELEIGLRSISVPYFSIDGKCVCAVNISVSTSRMTPDEMMRTMLPILIEQRREVNYLRA